MSTIKQIVKFDYCCESMRLSIENYPQAVHISQTEMDRKIGPLYMNVVLGDESILPAFMKFCP